MLPISPIHTWVCGEPCLLGAIVESITAEISGGAVINKTPFHVGHVIAVMHLPGGCTKEEHCDRTRPRHLLGHED